MFSEVANGLMAYFKYFLLLWTFTMKDSSQCSSYKGFGSLINLIYFQKHRLLKKLKQYENNIQFFVP